MLEGSVVDVVVVVEVVVVDDVVEVVAGGAVVVVGDRCLFGGTVVVVEVVEVEVDGLEGAVEYVGGAARSSGERSPVVTVTSVPIGSVG